MAEEKQKTPMDAGPPLLEWQAHEKPQYERTWRWYTVVGTLAIALLAYSMWTASWSLAILVTLVAITYTLIRKQTNVVHRIRIYERGLSLDNRFTPWRDCAGFWMLQGEEYVELHIERKKGQGNNICIQTGKEDIRTIHELLSQVLPYIEGKTEHPLDTIARLLKI